MYKMFQDVFSTTDIHILLPFVHVRPLIILLIQCVLIPEDITSHLLTAVTNVMHKFNFFFFDSIVSPRHFGVNRHIYWVPTPPEHQ